ncbi:hypothetical protein [Chryseobacterium indoltheticum]|uniref:hypothetical protein n=1 Tax=Chryseobacterium indoltheticum TaxID=254 RepID=UPI003F495593
MLRENKIRPSMTGGYDCYQNALAERINGILRTGISDLQMQKYPGFKTNVVKESIYIYNNKKGHILA